MDECTQACCGATARRTVSELFDRGLRRSRQSPLALQGRACVDGNGFSACFSLALERDAIAKIGFVASTCVTLIAYCELIAELTLGQDLARAAALAPDDLIAELPGVPALKRDRALLAIAAFRAALAAAESGRQSHRPTRGKDHESRLYLRHAAP